MELIGALIGVGIAAAAPLIPGLRPVAKAVIKSGMAVAGATVTVAAVVTEQVSDLVSQARSEHASETIVDAEVEEGAASEHSAQPAASGASPSTQAAGVSAPSLRPLAKAAVKSGMSLASAAQGAAGVAVAATALTGQRLGDMVSGLSRSTEATPDSAGAEGVEGAAEATQAESEAPKAPAVESPAPPSPVAIPDQAQPAAADDLTRVNGIGPKAAVLLQEAGITTFAQLAAAPVSQLRAILDQAGARYRVTDPSSWPAQAQALVDAPTPVWTFDDADLVQIDGIGPKIALLLQEAGIATISQLADTPVESLRAVLDQGGPRYRVTDPATWPAQAQALLAAASTQPPGN